MNWSRVIKGKNCALLKLLTFEGRFPLDLFLCHEKGAYHGVIGMITTFNAVFLISVVTNSKELKEFQPNGFSNENI